MKLLVTFLFTFIILTSYAQEGYKNKSDVFYDLKGKVYSDGEIDIEIDLKFIKTNNIMSHEFVGIEIMAEQIAKITATSMTEENHHGIKDEIVLIYERQNQVLLIDGKRLLFSADYLRCENCVSIKMTEQIFVKDNYKLSFVRDTLFDKLEAIGVIKSKSMLKKKYSIDEKLEVQSLADNSRYSVSFSHSLYFLDSEKFGMEGQRGEPIRKYEDGKYDKVKSQRSILNRRTEIVQEKAAAERLLKEELAREEAEMKVREEGIEQLEKEEYKAFVNLIKSKSYSNGGRTYTFDEKYAYVNGEPRALGMNYFPNENRIKSGQPLTLVDSPFEFIVVEDCECIMEITEYGSNKKYCNEKNSDILDEGKNLFKKIKKKF